MIKNVPGSSHYFDFDETAFKVGITLLEKDGYHQIQRPHRKLPALMDYWEKTLKETGYPVTWYSKRIKGRRTVVHAVAGAHFINDGKFMTYCIRVFGDFETEEYEKNH